MDYRVFFVEIRLILHIISGISTLMTIFTVYVIYKGTPKEARQYSVFLIFIESICLYTVWTWAWLAPSIASHSLDGPIVCYMASIYPSIGSFLGGFLGFRRVFPQEFTMYVTYFGIAMNTAAYAHTLFYRHQVSIDQTSHFRLNKWQRYSMYSVFYVLLLYITYEGSIMDGVDDLKTIRFSSVHLREALLEMEISCAFADFYRVGIALLLGMILGGLIFTFLAVHAYLSIRSHANLHRRVQELSLILLYSMIAQILVFFLLIFVPSFILVLLFDQEALTIAWSISGMLYGLNCLSCSSIIIFSSRTYKIFIQQSFLSLINKKPHKVSGLVVSSHLSTQPIIV